MSTHTLLAEASLGNYAAITWSQYEGFRLHVPETALASSVPLPVELHALSMCYARLTSDAEFAKELFSWCAKHQN